jgi:undecaprenyl-diphosphatase
MGSRVNPSQLRSQIRRFLSGLMNGARAGGLSLWLGGALLALLAFVRITRELIEGEVGAIDSAILLAMARLRTPWLTVAAVDVTALGSITLVVLFSAFTLLVLLVLRDRLGAIQLLAASSGAGILTLLTKDLIERIRPAEAQQLIVVSGFSYPSGHSVSTSALYLTIAIIAGRYVQNTGARISIVLAASVVVMMVGSSRVYLGVHYATDVLSGISLGAAWALLLAAFFRARWSSRLVLSVPPGLQNKPA